MTTYHIMDLFCGTGAFSKGFENAEAATFKTIFGIDLLPISVETFRLNHKDSTALAEDIRKVSTQEVANILKVKRGEIDIIIGGPPCQGFSSIRPFRSTNNDDPRNNLFHQFVKFVDYFRPKAFVMENVVGLATHNRGQTIETMEESFSNLGYSVNWKILNAAHFGIPQRRERLILIGLEKGVSPKFPTPLYTCDEPTIGYKDKSRLLLPNSASLFNQGAVIKPAITVLEAINDLPVIASGEESNSYDQTPLNEYQKSRRKKTEKLQLHYSTKHTPKMLEIIKHAGPNINAIPKHLITSGFSSCYSRLDGDKPAVTITVNFVHPASNRCIHPKLDRALTPREGARLQSFDDDFIFAGNKSQIVKQIGNAVPPLLGKAVAEVLAECLN